MALRAKKYFRDYDVRETINADGRIQKELIYCGDWYRRDCSDRQRTAERWTYFLSSAAAAGLLLTAMLQRVEANISDPWVQTVSLLAMIPAFCVLEGAAEAFFRKGNLKKENYRERLLMLRVMSLVGALLNLLLFAGYGAAAAGETLTAGTMIPIVFTGINVLIYGAIGIREIRVRYHVIKAPPRALDKNEKQNDARKYFD